MKLSDSLKRFILAYSPFIRGDKKKTAELRLIIKKLKESETGFFDPVRRFFLPVFHEYIAEIDREAEHLRSVYQSGLSSDGKQLQEFETALAGSVIEKLNHELKDFSFREIRKGAAESGNSGIRNIDGIFRQRLKLFSNKIFRSYTEGMVSNSVLADFTALNLKQIHDAFPRKKNGKPDRLDGELIIEQLEDIYFILKPLSEIKTEPDDPVFAFAASDSHDELFRHKIRLIELSSCLSNEDFLLNTIKLLREAPDYTPKTGSYSTAFPDNIRQGIIEQFKKHRQLYIENANQQMLKTKTISLFEDRDLQPVQVYNTETGNLLNEHGLPVLKYVNTFKICKSFFLFFFEDGILPIVQQLLLDAEFSHEIEKNKLSDSLENTILISERINKFEEDLTIPSFSAIHPFVEMLRSGIIEKKEKLNAEKAVVKLNGEADKIIQDVFAVSTELRLRLSEIIVDIKARNPKLLTNALYLNNRKGDFYEKLETAERHLDKFIRLLKLFSVNISEIKSGIESPEGKPVR